MSVFSHSTRGVIPIVPTPFDAAGRLNLSDVPKLVDYYAACGAIGLTVLGVMGEANKLSPEERRTVVRAFVEHCDRRLPLIVGATDPSLEASVELGRFAVEAGAAGVMLQPMSGLVDGDPVVDYFARFTDRTDGRVPVCVQDFPQNGGVATLPATWARISWLDSVFMLKHEPPAGLQKLSAIRAAEAAGEARRVPTLTSNNAMHLPEELYRGADGAMVGVAFTDIVVAICTLFWDGEAERANDLHDAMLPLVRHETQGAFGLAIRKEILSRRAGLAGKALRYPAAALAATDLAELDRMIQRLRRRLAQLDYEPALPL